MVERLPPQPHEWLKRGQALRFEFEGTHYEGFQGDTLSSALWANGRHTLGRSFKYHRPRGILSFANNDATAMFESGDEVNIRGDIEQARAGQRLTAVNTMGGVDRDRLGIMNHFGAFTPVGFYYKAFHKPKSLFPFFENQIRQVAGLGRVNVRKRHKPTPKDYEFCDVLVIGGGPAGMSAALRAAEAGADVLLVEEQRALGGSLLYQPTHYGPAGEEALKLEAQVNAHPNIRLSLNTCVVGYYADHWVALLKADRLTKTRAGAVVFATGCCEQPAVFRNNDLPGIMLATAAQRLIHQFAVKPFNDVVILTANAEGYAAALDFLRAGIRVVAILDLRETPDESAGAELKRRGIPIHAGTGVYSAVGGHHLKSIEYGSVVRGKIEYPTGSFAADGLAMSVGYASADNLLRQARARMEYKEGLEQFVCVEAPEGAFAAGRINGFYALADQLKDGAAAGHDAAAHAKKSGVSPAQRPARPASGPNHPYPVFSHPHGKNFVDWDEDLQLKDFENAIQEGFDNMELLKRYSTVGMGPSQGRHSNLNALRILAHVLGQPMAGKQVTTARPFATPVPMSKLAGRTFTPFRRTPAHQCQEQAGARLMFAGNWIRPEYFPAAGKTRLESIQAESLNVRQRAGLIDLGTLGKMELNGPDAVEFLERIYTGKFAGLKIGASRYGVALDESGVVIDDGVISRLGEHHFYFTTTSSGADAIYREMQRHIMLWKLDVTLINLTGQYGAFNLAGPLSREILQPLTDVDLSAEAFPYLGMRRGRVAGVPARLTRVGFVGELGFEIHMPADGAVHLWNALLRQGAGHGLAPFGVEAQRLMRLEKGHIIISQDTDGLTHPLEAGLGWALKMDKPYFIGQRSIRILEKQPIKRKLAGFTLDVINPHLIPKECHLVLLNGEITGRVTSIYASPTLNKVIGLAYVAPQQATPGSKISIRIDGGTMVQATIVLTPFYDPENKRQ